MDSNSGLSDSKVHLLISFNSFSFGLHHIVVKQRQGGLNFIFILDLIVLSTRTVCWDDSGTYPFPSGQWPQTRCHPRRPGQMQRLVRALLKLSLCRRDPRDDKALPGTWPGSVMRCLERLLSWQRARGAVSLASSVA